jgi:hypothetical protein
MEDDLKALKVEYLSNHWSDLSQWKTTSNRKRPPTEDDLKK